MALAVQRVGPDVQGLLARTYRGGLSVRPGLALWTLQHMYGNVQGAEILPDPSQRRLWRVDPAQRAVPYLGAQQPSGRTRGGRAPGGWYSSFVGSYNTAALPNTYGPYPLPGFGPAGQGLGPTGAQAALAQAEAAANRGDRYYAPA